MKIKYKLILDTLQNLINPKYGHTDVSKDLAEFGINTTANALTNRFSNDGYLNSDEVAALEKKHNINLSKPNTIDTVTVTYRPDVFLSAGYGVQVYNEAAEMFTIDAKMLVTERGLKINPKNCEIVSVSGNSMAPEYKHGDKVIIDKGDIELSDGHIFAIRYQGRCFVKEINLLGNKIKCISLNKEYDSFYIESGEEFTVLGRILPRIRL